MFFITLSETIRVFLIFIIIFFIMPLMFMKNSNNSIPLLERFFFGFACIILFQIVSVHTLVLVKLFDVISISIIVVIALIILVKRDRNREMRIAKFLSKRYLVFNIMDHSKHRKAFFHNQKSEIKNILKGISDWFWKVRKEPIYSFLFFAVLILSAMVRLRHSFVHYAYPHLDMYLHLKWVKALMSNNMYLDDKIYPKAMHSIMAFISKLTFSDPYWIVRYFGPFCAILLVISIYFLAFKITGNRYLSLLAMAIYGLTIDNNILPSQAFRQTATMPQEFGMLFIVLGYAFLIDYLKTLSKRNLFSFEACLLIALMSHSFSGLYLIFWTAVAVISSLIFKKVKWKAAVKLVGISAVVVGISFVPLVLGRLLGKVFHESSLAMVTDVTGIKISELLFKKYFFNLLFPDSVVMYALVFGCIGLLIAGILIKPKYWRMDTYSYLSLFTSTVIIYMAYHIESLFDTKNLPELLGRTRIGPFLSLLLPVGVSIILFSVIDLLDYCLKSLGEVKRDKFKRSASTGIILLYVTASLVTGSYTLNTFYKHVEYDQATEAYVRIKTEFMKKLSNTGNWYVVSTDPQLAEVTGYGWYEEGYQFAHYYTKEQVMDPKFRFHYPVNNIFIFVEKKPILYNEMISVDYGEKEIEPLNEDPFMQFYMDGNNRAIMEGHIWMIAEAYAQTHRGVSIYYEDKDFKIYRIYQEEVGNSQ